VEGGGEGWDRGGRFRVGRRGGGWAVGGDNGVKRWDGMYGSEKRGV